MFETCPSGRVTPGSQARASRLTFVVLCVLRRVIATPWSLRGRRGAFVDCAFCLAYSKGCGPLRAHGPVGTEPELFYLHIREVPSVEARGAYEEPLRGLAT